MFSRKRKRNMTTISRQCHPSEGKPKFSNKPVRMWRPQDLPENFAILLVSARRAGKTTLVKSLCIQEPKSWLSQFENGFIVAFCGNSHCASEYKQFLPGKYVHTGLREDIIQTYWRYCDELREQEKKPPKCLFIFDDVFNRR